MSNYKIQGSISNGFECVKKLFEKNFANKIEEHAQLCVYVGGTKVVDLYGTVDDAINYDGDSLTSVFSSTKNLAAISIATLVDKNLLKYSDKVIKHWPEYGNGNKEKESMTIAQITRHEGGMPKFTKTLTLADIQRENIKKNSIGRIVEKEHLRFPPANAGTKVQYHPFTRGLILNEIFRRVDPQHRTIGEWLREDISSPLNADAYIGLGYEELSRSVNLSAASTGYILRESMRPKSLGRKIESSLLDIRKAFPVLREMRKRNNVPAIEHMIKRDIPSLILAFDFSVMKTGEMPSGNGQCSARGLAKIAAMMANKGEIDGIRILSEKTWNSFHSACEQKRMYPFNEESNFSQGGVNYFTPVKNGMLFKHNKYRRGYFGWQGFGGSVFQWNPEYRIGFSYVPTFLAWEDSANTRAARLQKKVIDCVDALN